MKMKITLTGWLLLVLTASVCHSQQMPYAGMPPGGGYPPGYYPPAQGGYVHPAAYAAPPQGFDYGAPVFATQAPSPLAEEPNSDIDLAAAEAEMIPVDAVGDDCGCGKACGGFCGKGGGGKGGCCGPYRSIFGEYLYLRPRNAEIGYALPSRGPVAGGAAPVPLGAVATVDSDYSSGYRVGFRVGNGCDAAVVGTFTKLESSVTDQLLVNPPNAVFPLVVHPSTLNNVAPTTAAGARLDITFELFDLDYEAILWQNCSTKVNYLFGARYGRLEQDFGSTFNFNGTTNVASNMSFDGGGLRVGLNFERSTARPAWSFYGKSVASFLGGEFDGRYVQTNTPGTLVTDARWTASRVVTMLDLELGVAWTSPGQRIRLNAGYMFSGWFDVVNLEDYIEGVQQNQFDDLGSSMSFDGLVAGVDVRY